MEKRKKGEGVRGRKGVEFKGEKIWFQIRPFQKIWFQIRKKRKRGRELSGMGETRGAIFVLHSQIRRPAPLHQ